MKGSGRQAGREPDHKHPAWETNEKKWETNEKKWETNKRKWGTSRPGTHKQKHKHPAWETNERKWETSHPGTRLQAPSLGDK